MSDDKPAARSFDALNSRGLAGKREYVRSLELRSDQESLSLLVECLCDESWYLRELAEEALLRVGERATVALLPLLDQGLWFSRACSARVLGRMGFRGAVSPLLRLCDDANETVAMAAREALAEIAHRGGSFTLAHALHRLPPDLRRRRFDELAAGERALGERLGRLMRNEELMSAEGADALHDESELVRASEEGVEWEVLTGPPPARPRPENPGEGHAGPSNR